MVTTDSWELRILASLTVTLSACRIHARITHLMSADGTDTGGYKVTEQVLG